MDNGTTISYGSDMTLVWIVGILVVGTAIGLQLHKLFRDK